ncbi:hypothetical protein E8S05_003388 [Escherichia coli]|nr:hypothetical protein [Escherichia coli]
MLNKHPFLGVFLIFLGFKFLSMYVITETVRKTAMQIRWRGMYQRLLKVDPLKCILCGSQMRFTGLKRGYRLAELLLMHERLARQQVCG